MECLAKIIRQFRKEKGISQTELANMLNTTCDTISLWELNKRSPSIEDLIKLSKILNYSTDYLLGVKDIADSKVYEETFEYTDNERHIKHNKKNKA